MKKICFLAFNFNIIGGAQKMTVSVANKLCANYEVHLLVVCKFDKTENYLINKNIKIKSLGMDENCRARDSLFHSSFKIKDYINKNKINILIVSGSLGIPSVFFIKPFLKCKIIFWDHESLRGRDWKSVFFRKMACILSNKILVITQETFKDYYTKIPKSRDKLIQIYNFLESTKSNHKYNPDTKMIISVGRISYEKGFHLAVEVAKIIFKKHPDWSWHIYGEGEQKHKIEQLIKEKGLENNLILKGKYKDVYNVYNKYSIFVMPSLREGFSLALLEAKVNKLPSVSFNCPAGPSEILKNSFDGFLIECYNTLKMAEKVNYLIENRDKRIEFSENCRLNLESFEYSYVIFRWNAVLEIL
ncbi:MAG: glycosyltransferase [Oscillospiraceae bacterium]|jgi:glycosyltransferase involved in cell wall biosynthesis|nr:glycosyltransferase [Oscillospiraceae bacterium]